MLKIKKMFVKYASNKENVSLFKCFVLFNKEQPHYIQCHDMQYNLQLEEKWAINE